jgi:TonB-linked SusC/RagA family outer membrane protein
MFLENIFKIIKGTLRKTFCVLCICGCCSIAFAQTRVSGRVIDVDNVPIAGASVVEKGTTNGVVTDNQGNYSLSVQDAGSVLQVSYVGFVVQDITVGNRTEVNITLTEDTQALEEVVVVGYGTQKKANLSGAVAVVSSEAIANRPVTSVGIALQGMSPNVNITRSSGDAGASAGINIRGFTSINGGGPLILVDNVPTDIARINPADVESVSVLKDASSAAIYGGRAAFGVILITTKTAKSEKIQVDVDYNRSFRQFDNIPEMITHPGEVLRMEMLITEESDRWSPESLAYADARAVDPSLPAILGPGRENGGLNPRLIDEGRWEYYGANDWFDMMLKDFSPNQTANIRISQNGKKFSYSASGGLFEEDGMIKYSSEKYKRLNFRANATYHINDRWTVGTNSVFNRIDYRTEMDGGVDDFNWFFRLHTAYCIDPIYNPDGTYTTAGANLAHMLEGGYSNTLTDETQLSFNSKFDIIKGVWSVSGDATFNNTYYAKENFVVRTLEYHANAPGATLAPPTNHAELHRNINRRTVYNLYTNFDKTFAGKHTVSAMLGYNQEEFAVDNTDLTGKEVITTSLPDIHLTQDEKTFTHGIAEEALRGAFGRVNYIYDGKYILEANGRYDGSSRFTKGMRFGFFPSFSAAWVVSRERFLEGIIEKLKISNLKFRGSYGTLGNQSIEGSYPTIATMSLNPMIGPVIDGSRPQGMAAPGSVPGSLTWEVVRTVNGGIDLALLSNRFDVSFDIYTRYTEGMLTKSKTLPSVFGTDSPRANAADLRTEGWELSAGWRDDFEVGGSPLSCSLRVMIADSRAWITRFDNPNKNLADYYEGQELGEIWGYTTLGYFQSDDEAANWVNQSALATTNSREYKAGMLKLADLNDDGYVNAGNVSVNEPGDRKIIGNSRERLPYSIDMGASWKGFDLRVFLQGVGKRDAYPQSDLNQGIYFWGVYANMYSNPNTKNRDSWSVDNRSAFFPKLAQGNPVQEVQTKYLQDASYLRLKNVMLGYTFPAQWMQKIKVRSLRVYFSGENLYTWHHIQVKGNDPERFGASVYYPFQRTFSFGMNLGF